MILTYHFRDRYPFTTMAVVEEKEPWETQALYIRVMNRATPSHHSAAQWLPGAQATA